MIEEDGMHRFADGVVAPEGEREVGYAAGGPASRQVGLDPADCLDEVRSEARMLGNARADREHIDIEYDVGRIEAGLVHQQ